MFQKEVAEKILGKSYGRLSIIANYRLKNLDKFDVSANCFVPKPKVTSTVIHMAPVKKVKYKINDIKNLEYITNIFFSNKRKMIKKNIYKILDKDKIKKIDNLDLKLRPANIKPEVYYRVTELIEFN
jgi:16S rRNA (adenine1518-N6/adenine1519-N6)-dimethyltransferase